MDFKDQVKQLGERIHKLKDNISTEEATKTAFVMPMIQILGYDVFNPLEVVPEFTCDIGVKKGEKIDYAILDNGTPLLLLECKHWNKNLNLHEGQLLRYFQVSKAKFGVLTNGVVYRFYTDLERVNLMDEKPFLEVNITSIKSNEIEELKKFHKSYFDLDSIISSATDLKYMNEIKGIITSEMSSPSDWFIRGIAKNVYPGSITTKIVEQFSELIAQSFVQVINGMVTSRLESALNREEESRNEEPVITEEMEDGIITTEEELEGYYTVRAVLKGAVNLDRIAYRDTLSYFGILLDGSNRKPICRLHFNKETKYIGIFGENKKETKYELKRISDVGDYKDAFLATIANYDSGKDSSRKGRSVEPGTVETEQEPEAESDTGATEEADTPQKSAPKNWFYFDSDGNKVGPLSSLELKGLAASGVVRPNTAIETANGRRSVAGRITGLAFE